MTSKRILVIEDDPLNMKFVETVLNSGGYEVLNAFEAESGLNIAAEERPDLILMDIQLPGMDGLTATRRIKNHVDLKAIPVLALTSHAMEGDEQKAFAAGCDGYITKPVRPKLLLEELSKYINNPKKIRSKKAKGQHKDRVLIVDDEELNVKLIATKLCAENYEIFTAFNGRDALNIADEVLPDIILLDIMMPLMDGYEVIRQLKANPETNNIPVILVTSLSEAEHAQRGMAAGADDFLNKPVNTTELLTRIKSLIRLNKYHEQLNNRTQTEHFFGDTQGFDHSIRTEKSRATVFLVEDNERDIRLMKKHLFDLPIQLVVLKNGDDALRLMKDRPCDVMLLDIFLPGTDGFNVCRIIKENEATRSTQIVVTTAMNDFDNKIRCIELGADDFIVKPVHQEEIKARVRALIKKKEYLDRLSMKYESAVQAAMTDKLTGMFNQAFFKYSLEIEVNRVKRHHQALGLLMIDVDDFKMVNDTLGHQVGDDILHDIGILIKLSVRDVDLCARYGGEEFAVMLPYVDTTIAIEVAERIRKAVEGANPTSQTSSPLKPVTISIGVALLMSNIDNAQKLVQKADIALYRAKRTGKNRVCCYESESTWGIDPGHHMQNSSAHRVRTPEWTMDRHGEVRRDEII